MGVVFAYIAYLMVKGGDVLVAKKRDKKRGWKRAEIAMGSAKGNMNIDGGMRQLTNFLLNGAEV